MPESIDWPRARPPRRRRRFLLIIALLVGVVFGSRLIHCHGRAESGQRLVELTVGLRQPVIAASAAAR